jgi:glycosyltransferase involved in cell wall biosynthesis
MELVSVIIPAYNQGHFLAEAVQSVLDQTYSAVEVLVVDDGSTDDTAVVGQSFADARVHYIYQENRGLSGARNTGIRQAQGRYLTFLDSDDYFLPEKISLLMKAFAQNPTWGLVAGQSIPVNEEGQQIAATFDRPVPANAAELLLHNPLHVGSVLLKRSWQEQAGFFDETLRSYEDWDMWLRLALAGCPMGWVAQPVSCYRFHSNQMTRDGRQMTTATFMVLDKLFKQGQPLPADWLALQDKAYSSAYIRAAAQSYRVPDYDEANGYLAQAIALNPEWLARDAQDLRTRLVSFTALPKTADPVPQLAAIYDHLPQSLAMVQAYKATDVAQAALALAFVAAQRQDWTAVRHALGYVRHYQPRLLLNRGVMKLFIRAYLLHS